MTKFHVKKVIFEITKQELISKTNLMIGGWQSIALKPKSMAEFNSIRALQSFHEKPKPTLKKVLSSMTANCQNDGERDAFNYLKEFL